ncbi:hypothetical protein BH10BAC3_BH10BAC3_28390 [soil metagenome]
MKKSIVFIGFLVTCLFLHARQLPDYDTLKLKVKQDYTPDVDNGALGAANYLLATPI